MQMKKQKVSRQNILPEMMKPRGLYDPRFEHDACGVGMICNMHGEKSHRIIADGLQILVNLTPAAVMRPPVMARAF